MKKLFAAAVLAAAVSAAFAAMPEKVTIAYVKAPFNLQNMVMKERGMLEKAFAKDGVKVEWKTITSGAKQGQAMAAGSVDVSAVMNTASLLMANGAGNPVLVASGVAHPTDTFAIVGRPGASMSVKDLKGKKVAGPRGTVLHQLLVAALLKNGMKADDVEFISMDPGSAMTALTSGRVDAALLAASLIIKAEDAGCKVITTAKGLVDVNLVMTASKKFADQYPEALTTVVKTEREALDWINGNWQEALKIGAKEHNISLKDAEQLAKWSNYYSKVTEKDIKGLEADQKFLLDNKLMNAPVDVKSLVLPIAMQ
jgi:sulfonate transport system substrate-binding protein